MFDNFCAKPSESSDIKFAEKGTLSTRKKSLLLY